jgi:branched-chain amino acid transport system substrate-binding protein
LLDPFLKKGAKKMKKLLIGVIIWASLAAIISSCGKKEPGAIKIGAILPLTGDAAAAGVNTKLGIDLAVEKINSEGGLNGKRLEVLYEDDQGQAKNAVSIIHKLTDIDKVCAIIDNSLSNITLAIAPVANEKKTVVIATGASSPKITDAGDYIFRIWNSDNLEGEAEADFTFDSLRIASTSILYINNDYGLGLSDVFEKKFIQKGGFVTCKVTFQPGDKDFKNQITKILTKKMKAIYIIGYPAECVGIFKQLKALAYNGILLGTVVMADPQIRTILNETGDKCYYPIPKQPNPENPSVSRFLNAYRTKHMKDPPMLADVGYDAINLFAMAINASKDVYSGDAIKQFFYELPGFDGASGHIKFDQNGDVRKPILITK